MLIPLLRRMLNLDPAKRPSAAEALALFRTLKENVWVVQRAWRARPRDESYLDLAVLDTASLVRSYTSSPRSQTQTHAAVLQSIQVYFLIVSCMEIDVLVHSDSDNHQVTLVWVQPNPPASHEKLRLLF